MKGKYTKPVVMMESFSLTGGLLRECTPSFSKDYLNGSDPSTCYWDMGSGNKIFILGACNLDGEEMGYGCYNNLSEESYVFRS